MRTIVGSKYNDKVYWVDEAQEDAIRRFWREEDKRPENQPIKKDQYGDDLRFGGALSGLDRPRNLKEYKIWRTGGDYLEFRRKSHEEGKKRWNKLVDELGLEEAIFENNKLVVKK